MAHGAELAVPSLVNDKLNRRNAQWPEMTISTGSTKAVVVFHTQGKEHFAYYRMSINGSKPVTRVITEPTSAAVTERVLGIIFNSGSRQVPLQSLKE
jgi:hypothetical protein